MSGMLHWDKRSYLFDFGALKKHGSFPEVSDRAPCAAGSVHPEITRPIDVLLFSGCHSQHPSIPSLQGKRAEKLAERNGPSGAQTTEDGTNGTCTQDLSKV